ncbi:MAG: porin family protein [Chlorobium sp.]|nr:MAG: porin family protein [Chlorobium sp.]
MKKVITLLLTAAAISFPSCTGATVNPYVSITPGIGLMNNWDQNNITGAITFRNGFAASGAIGLKNDFTRIEAAVGYQHNLVDTFLGAKAINDGSNVDFWTFMANGYVDYEMKGAAITPYLMAGLGVADVCLNDNVKSENHSTFVWQIGAGAGFRASEKVIVDLGFRYLSPSNITSDSGNRYSMSSSNILAGIRYTF